MHRFLQSELHFLRFVLNSYSQNSQDVKTQDFSIKYTFRIGNTLNEIDINYIRTICTYKMLRTAPTSLVKVLPPTQSLSYSPTITNLALETLETASMN